MLQEIKARHAPVKMQVTENECGITVDAIIVPADLRRQGRGTAAMMDLQAYARSVGKPIALTPDSIFGTPKSVLVRWYKSLGFRMNTGRRKDFRFQETMIWEP